MFKPIDIDELLWSLAFCLPLIGLGVILAALGLGMMLPERQPEAQGLIVTTDKGESHFIHKDTKRLNLPRSKEIGISWSEGGEVRHAIIRVDGVISESKYKRVILEGE